MMNKTGRWRKYFGNTGMIDYLVVGAGLYGATFAREATNAGKKCLVIDRRNHIAGNIYTQNNKGIDVHKYGPHIFHTNSGRIWDYVNRFAEFNNYKHKVLSYCDERYYSFPININTLEQLWGNYDDATLLNMFQCKRNKNKPSNNLEEWAIIELGEEIYQKFIYGYTKKQWGVDPKELPSSIISRIPIRTNRNDDYHNCVYSGVPKNGYTEMVKNMLDGIQVILDENYFDRQDYWDNLARKIVYTGPIDEFFNYKLGELQWRSLRFEEYEHAISYVQPVAQINYPEEKFEHTRSIEHKHFNNTNTPHTLITLEYSQKYERGKEKYYPINDKRNNSLYKKYKQIIPNTHIFGGRLAEYKYYDMDQVIGAAISRFRKYNI